MNTYPWTAWFARELLEWAAALGLLMILPWAHYHRNLAPELKQVQALQAQLADQLPRLQTQAWETHAADAMRRMQALVAATRQRLEAPLPIPDLKPVQALRQTAPPKSTPPRPATGPLVRLANAGPEDVVWTAIDRYFHAPYRYGGEDVFGIDCSALVQGTFAQLGIDLPRTAQGQFDAALGVYVGLSDLRPGDLLFFHTRRKPYVSHVGIYVGNDTFLHAPRRGRRVEIAPLSAYYRQRFVAGKRILADPFDAFAQTHHTGRTKP